LVGSTASGPVQHPVASDGPGKLQNGGNVRVLLDRDADKLVFEFTTDEAKPKQLPPPEKSEENV
jgi:hypothetical protein